MPTYMMFDDHDVTDDWNLNPMWLDRVYTTPLGVTILRNALVTYAVFQDWGNDPLKYENPLDDKNKLLEPHRRAVPARRAGRPERHRRQRHRRPVRPRTCARPTDIEALSRDVDPPIKWHFSVAGPGSVVGRARQPHAAQLRLAQRPARQRRRLDRAQRQTSRFPPAPFTDGTRC